MINGRRHGLLGTTFAPFITVRFSWRQRNSSAISIPYWRKINRSPVTAQVVLTPFFVASAHPPRIEISYF